MRSALALLVMVSGCNWAFGLKPTEISDAGDGTDAPPEIRTGLVWGTPSGTALIAPNPPTVLVGEPLGGAPLTEVAYDNAGTFPIPYTLREAPHRIVFTMPGETIAHEIQWSVSGATIVVPRASRADAPPVPSGGGYAIKVAPPAVPLIATTGVYTYTRGGAGFTASDATTTRFTFANAQPLAGPLVSPADTDSVILGDWVMHGGGLWTVDGYAIASAALMSGSLSTTMPTWVTDKQTFSTGSQTMPSLPVVDAMTRLPSGTVAQYLAYGISPSLSFPGFVDGKPMILPLMEATQTTTSFQVADPSTMLTGAERVFAGRVTSTRTVSGADLTSFVGTVTTTFSGPLKFDAPLAKNISLNATALATDTTFTATSQAASLKWDAEADKMANLYTVTLYEIASSKLTPLRIYHVLAPSVAVDGSLLQATHQYVFAITADKGYTNASQGDFKVVTYPFSESTTFSGAFTVQ